MGFYRRQVLPRLQDKVMAADRLRGARARVCASLSGDVVEVGFGTGLNIPYYPTDVKRVYAIEPSAMCMRISEPRRKKSRVLIEYAGLAGERIELEPESADAVLSTWTLCTIPDLDSALAELRRILKPGGSFHFVEHGRAPDPKVARWQRRIEPARKRLTGGCHITRRIAERVADAGFTIDHLTTYYLEGEPKAFGFTFEGQASKSSVFPSLPVQTGNGRR